MYYRHVPALLALWACPALAHVTANPNEGEAGSYFQTSLRIAHGCEKSPTTAIRVSIPEGITSARPQAKPGWKVKIAKKKLPQPIEGPHGTMIDEVVTDITWSGGKLPSDHYDDFGLLLKLPEKGEVLWFPVVQTCAGGVNRWVEIPTSPDEWHERKSPAPFVKLTPAQLHHH